MKRIALASVCLAFCAVPASGAAAGTQMIATNGFNSPSNSYSWSMTWFKGKLYVGTARKQLCVESATVDFYNPGSYRSPPDGFPEVDCPPDPYDMDLRAEIWCFDPVVGSWTRVYQSPADIPNPRAPGKFVARDIGFRNMIVHRRPNGQPALYIAGVTTDEYIPELAATHPPRILRTTDGKRFRALHGSPGVLNTPFGPQRAMGYRAMASYKGRMFVTAGGGLTGDGVIVEVKRPWSSSPSFVQVSPETIAVFELVTFNGALYLGAGDAQRGYSVWKTTMSSPPRFLPIVRDGAGRGRDMTSVVSMHVFKRRLYVGASGWGLVFPTSELIRIGRDDRYDVVAGNGRLTPEGDVKFPISGLPDGFGNIFNGHFWRQETRDGALYLGTNDWSWAFRNWPIVNLILGPEFGFDVFGTCDGQYWWPVTRDAFGAGLYNFGARTMVSTRAGGFIGSANHAKGTAVWRNADMSPCRPGGIGSQSVGARARVSVAAPRRLLTDVQSCGTVLSWERAPDAAGYRILRSTYRVAHDVRVRRAPSLPGAGIPDVPMYPTRSGGSSVDLAVAGRPRAIGVTRSGSFIDRTARAGRRYAYEIVGLRRRGVASGSSNLAIVPSARPAVTFADAAAAVRDVKGFAARATSGVAAARRAWARGGRRVALARLARSSAALPPQAAADARDAIRRLVRQLEYAGACRR